MLGPPLAGPCRADVGGQDERLEESAFRQRRSISLLLLVTPVTSQMSCQSWVGLSGYRRKRLHFGLGELLR